MKNKFSFIIVTLLEFFRNLEINSLPVRPECRTQCGVSKGNGKLRSWIRYVCFANTHHERISDKIIFGFRRSLVITLLFSIQLISSDIQQVEEILNRPIISSYDRALDAVKEYVKSGGKKGQFPRRLLEDFITQNKNINNPLVKNQKKIIDNLLKIEEGNRSVDKLRALKHWLAKKFNSFTKRILNSQKMDEIEDLADQLNRANKITDDETYKGELLAGETFPEKPDVISQNDLDQLLDKQNRIELNARRAADFKNINNPETRLLDQAEIASKQGWLTERNAKNLQLNPANENILSTERSEGALKAYKINGTYAELRISGYGQATVVDTRTNKLVFATSSGKETGRVNNLDELDAIIRDNNLDDDHG